LIVFNPVLRPFGLHSTLHLRWGDWIFWCQPSPCKSNNSFQISRHLSTDFMYCTFITEQRHTIRCTETGKP